MQTHPARGQSPLRAVLGAATLALCAAPLGADVPSPGYQLASQPLPAAFAVSCTLPGGDLVTFDGLSVDRWTPGGALVGSLATFPAPVFASFVVPTPDGSAVVLGESQNGDLFLAQADGSGSVPLVNLPFNYDADWLPSGELLVSAAIGGFGPGIGNDLFRVALNPPKAVHLGHVDGPSGPVATTSAGALYYATQSEGAGPPPGETDVLFWPAATVQAGNLSEANALTFGKAFDGGASLAVDPVTGSLYMAESNFGLGEYRVLRVGPDKAGSPVVVDAGTSYLYGLEFVSPGGLGSFDPWQPESGTNLKVNNGFDQLTVQPKRPVLTVRGPGTTGIGPVTFQVTGGVPDGTMYATACPQAFLLPGPVAYPLATFLFVTSFDLKETRRASGFVPLDANGDGSFTIFNSGVLQGVYAWQFLVGDAQGVFLGSTTATQF